MQPQRLLHPITRAIPVQSAARLPEDAGPLGGVTGPLTRDPVGEDCRPPGKQPVPQHAVEVVGGQLSALRPPIRGAPVHNLSQLKWLTFDPAQRRSLIE